VSMTAWRRKPPTYWAKGDTAPAIAEQLFDGMGTPVVLTGASVRFRAWAPGAASAEVDAAATITDAATGKVSYTPVAADTDTIGAYQVTWKVTFSGGAIEKFPNSTPQRLIVVDSPA
jgi:hypothetical protein